jgi:hypothetical protein
MRIDFVTVHPPRGNDPACGVDKDGQWWFWIKGSWTKGYWASGNAVGGLMLTPFDNVDSES